MTKKAIKISALIVSILVVALTAGVVMASSKSKAELPEYLGSEACLGCHVEKFTTWETSGHANMVVELHGPSDLPGDMNAASADLKAELLKASHIVAGQRFLARDGATGELKYLSVQWNVTTKQYVAYKGGSSWTTGCAGCHSTGWDVSTRKYASLGIGCESCHGPGREHILAKGDISKITLSANSAVCGQCHNGSGKMPDGVTWPVGYRPSMTSLEDAGYTYLKVDPTKGVPQYNNPKLRQYAMWEASGHANATNLLIDHGPSYPARENCINCHSTSAGLTIASGVKWDAEKYLVNDGVTCVACHDPHASTIPGQLRKEPTELCLSCHSVGRGNPAPVKIGTVRAPHSPQGDMLAGTGALSGIADTKGAHTGIACIECHMTEGNHLMKVIKPEDVIGTTRKDSCVACHTNSSAESRGVYMELWAESITKKLNDINTDVTVIEERLKANPKALTADETKSFENWRANFWYVRKDNSGGAHNFEYAIKILSQTQKEIAKLRAAMK